MEKVRALVFGEVAHDYDRVRPGYPAELIDDVLAFARLEEGGPVLDIGAGTGRATLALAARGAAVTALEPDPAMAAVLRGKAPGNVVVEVAALERTAAATNHFGLVTSAQSWHWTDPATRHEKVAALLRPEGALAVFWNRDWLADPALVEAHLAVHREIAPQMDPSLGPVAEREYPDLPDLAAHPAFAGVERRIYRWTRRLRREDTLALLGTHSEYRMLPEETRRDLFEALKPQLPDEVEFAGGTVLFLARRSRRSRRTAGS
jgi:SAM-dependent methyltransferase